ncbi:MAG TPA: hypothetical protein VFA90_00600 [Terriglobales bacterium]|nr:hypothetical protein [Terriglobales bacterium]
MRLHTAQKPRIPLWLKLVWTAWVLVWIPVYYRQYGAQNFLFYCDIGNLLITLALWIESRLIFSWQAVGLLAFQTLYTLDLLGALITGRHALGGTEYMFDPTIPLVVRLLGLYHIAVPPLLLWAVHRLGYDRRGWTLQTLMIWVLVPINFFWRPEYNVNWARGLGHEQHVVPPWFYLIAYLIVVPLVVYWPTNLFLRHWAKTHP